MTNREFLTAVVEMSETVQNAEIRDFAWALIGKIDAKNERARSTVSKEDRAVLERRAAVLEYFESNPTLVVTRDQVSVALGISPSAVSSAIAKLIANGAPIARIPARGKQKTSYTYRSV